MSRVRSSALETSHILRSTQGRVTFCTVRLDKSAPSGDYWVQFIDSATLPADGAVTLISCQKVGGPHVTGTDDFLDMNLAENPLVGANGIVAVLSTTEFTKTIAGAYLAIEAEAD